MKSNLKLINLSVILDQPYKYGFQTEINKEKFPKGINEKIVSYLSEYKNESYFLKTFRLKAFKKWKKLNFPTWSTLNIPSIDFNEITYYSIPKKPYNPTKINKIDNKILDTFEKLGIPLKKQNNFNNIAIDAIFDSISIITLYKEKLAKSGVIFCSISEAIQVYPELIKKFLGSVVSNGDNYFACLNSAIFSDGSFCYIPKNTKCPLELSTYFRINDIDSGQFERTLIIAEENSSVSYMEGCTAPKYDRNQLHAAVVELIAFSYAEIKYSTIQNWYSGNSVGIGGIYNFVTKRALCLGKFSRVYWTQIETGSAITWKYPSCILLGNYSSGEFYSVAIANNYQQMDTGTKMIHIGEKTKSKILSKGISTKFSKNTYRGLIKIGPNAFLARNFSQCDSFLLGSDSLSATYPYLDTWNFSAIIEHEAKISKINEEQLFYLAQRGISNNQSISLILNGFCKDVITMLPIEFALEVNKILSLKY